MQLVKPSRSSGRQGLPRTRIAAMKERMRAGPGIVLLLLLACTDFPPRPANVCGNGAVEKGEACDGHAVGPNECEPPGPGVGCRLLCDGTCPSGWGCGADG